LDHQVSITVSAKVDRRTWRSPQAQGRSNAAIASAFGISPRVVEKHVAAIFAKLGLPPSGNDNRRVLATIRYLEA